MTKKGKIKIDLEKEKKKELWEDEDYLRQVDKRDGRRVVEEYEEKKKKERKQEGDKLKNDLETKKRGRFTYLKAIAKYGKEELDKLDFPKGWEYDAVSTSGNRIRIYGRSFKSQFGIVFVLRSPNGNIYVKACRMSLNPTIDMGAIDTMVIQAENTLDSAKGLLLSDRRDGLTGLRKTKGGIVI